MENMLWVGIGVLILVGLAYILNRKEESKFINSIASVGLVAGALLGLIGAYYKDKNKNSYLQHRTHWSTKAVVEANRTQTGESGECVQSFKLDGLSYTFEKSCLDFLVETSLIDPPRVGDFLRVRYILPKNEGDKPEVLEAYNLTQELERVGGTLPCKPENPAHNLEAPSVSPEAPTRSRSRTLPAPRAE